MTRIALAKKAFSLLVGLAQRDVLPIHVVNSIFWAKVFPVLDLGSWLYVLADSAEAVLNELHVSWAKQLLGACPWHNSALVTSELGWEVSGFHLAVVSMAARRARLWMLPAEDLYGRMFRVAHSWPLSWSLSIGSMLEAAACTLAFAAGSQQQSGILGCPATLSSSLRTAACSRWFRTLNSTGRMVRQYALSAHCELASFDSLTVTAA